MRTAIVQTYPAHFYQTQLTLKTLRKCYPDLEHVIVIADTWSELAWPGYRDQCQSSYGELADEVWMTREIFQDFACLAGWPYARQQTFKLYLDTRFPLSVEEWLFVDGDVEFHAPMPAPGIVATKLRYQGTSLEQRDPGPGENSSQITFYIRRMLGSQWQYWLDPEGSDYILTTTHPPVKHMRRDILVALREFVYHQHRKTLIDLHWQLARDTRMSISEWELLEAFRQDILGEPVDWILNRGEFCSATWSSDRELGEDWFRERGIEIDPALWSQLPLAKYL
jgi:hypothetical protein